MRVGILNADCGIPVFADKGAAIHLREMAAALAGIGCDARMFATRLGPVGDYPVPVERLPAPARATDLSCREDKERAYVAAAEAAVDALVALHRRWPFDMIYERYSLWSAAGVRAAARLGVPVVMEVNAPLVPEQAAHRELVLVDIARAIEAEVMTGAEALACVSTGVADYCIGQGAAASRVHVIGNAIDPARFHPGIVPDRLEIPPDAFIIGFTGSLKRWHGIDILMQAFRQVRAAVPEAHLFVVGDGPKRPWVKGFLAGADLVESATLTHWIDHQRLPGLVAAMDVTTAPYPHSDDFYFSPLKLYEYLGVGRPVVASRIGEIATVVRDDESGILTPPGDAPALAAALIRLARDRAAVDRLAAGAAREGARHTWARNARAVVDLARQAREAA